MNGLSDLNSEGDGEYQMDTVQADSTSEESEVNDASDDISNGEVSAILSMIFISPLFSIWN